LGKGDGKEKGRERERGEEGEGVEREEDEEKGKGRRGRVRRKGNLLQKAEGDRRPWSSVVTISSRWSKSRTAKDLTGLSSALHLHLFMIVVSAAVLIVLRRYRNTWFDPVKHFSYRKLVFFNFYVRQLC